MKALVLREYGKLVYEDVPRPEIAPDEVLVKVEACGICGSDVHGLDGSTGRRSRRSSWGTRPRASSPRPARPYGAGPPATA